MICNFNLLHLTLQAFCSLPIGAYRHFETASYGGRLLSRFERSRGNLMRLSPYKQGQLPTLSDLLHKLFHRDIQRAVVFF